MIIGSALIAVVWLVSMPLWVSVVATVLGALLIEFCCLVFTTRLFRFASSQDVEGIAIEKTIKENEITDTGDIISSRRKEICI